MTTPEGTTAAGIARLVIPWCVLVGTTVVHLFGMKDVPALVLSVVPLLPVVAPERIRRRVLWLVLSLWGALVGATFAFAFALWAFPPAEGPHGERAMAIGQVFLGTVLGAPAGFVGFGKLTPRESADVNRMAKLCALSVPILFGIAAFRALR